MTRAPAILTALAGLLAALDAASTAQAQSDTAIRNAIVDAARAERAQAETLRRLDQRDHDRATRETWDRNNAKRDARSLRRFDR